MGRVRETILRYRAVVVAVFQLFLAAVAFYAAFAFRLETFTPWEVHSPYGLLFLKALPLLLVIRFGTFLAFDLFQGMWRYVSIADLLSIILAVSAGTVIFFPLAGFWLARGMYSGSIFAMDWAFCIILLGGARFAIRAFRETFAPMTVGAKRVLIVGAGDAGEMLLREMKTHQHLSYQPVGFVDDDRRKKGMTIHGVPVLGRVEDLPKLVEKEQISEVILSIPSASGEEIRRITGVCEGVAVRLKRLPTEGDIVRLTQIRDVELADLLERSPIRLDESAIRSALAGKRILVTGAGGSIGSEVVHQLGKYHPERVWLLDWSENSLFFLERELLDHYPELSFELVVGDIKDEERMGRLFRGGRFDYVYHAAAFKHVPLMECNPLEAVKNNVEGTGLLAGCAKRFGVKTFVLISSDKAVRPTSVMGATKRAAELFLSSLPSDGTQFLSVRFGNVLGSRGSVVPLFRKQIAEGGPVTVTDPGVVRYFMTIPEAVQLVLQAGSMGKGGEVFLLDMGEPVRILDLAKKLIRLSGFEPDVDIPVQIVGLRPGEKLYEELLVQKEGSIRTRHEKIWILDGEAAPPEDLKEKIDRLLVAARSGRAEDCIRELAALVPDYAPNNPEYQRILERTRQGTAG